jgi:phosphopantetheinyl transferase
MDVAGHFFAPEEVAALSAEPAEKQQYRFFEYWTFKEADIKARGMGLALPLDKCSVFTTLMITRLRSTSIRIWATMQHAGRFGSFAPALSTWRPCAESASACHAVL